MHLCFASLARKPYTAVKACSFGQFVENMAELILLGVNGRGDG